MRIRDYARHFKILLLSIEKAQLSVNSHPLPIALRWIRDSVKTDYERSALDDDQRYTTCENEGSRAATSATKQPFHSRFAEQNKSLQLNGEFGFKILLAFSGIRHNLPKKRGYNTRVAECKAAAHALLLAEGYENSEALLCNVDPSTYEAHEGELEENLAKRAEHYFSETKRVAKSRDAWACGNLEDFGQLISESGRSSIDKYECGSKEMIQLYEILLKAPGVYEARFSGAGFRGCCLAIVAVNCADKAAEFVTTEYEKAQPELVSHIPRDKRVLVCEPGGSARIILPEI
ncbi:hypothetical protein LUZ61_001243 [Rhynchospora tenuis]|uniref:GHMP kinase C-terminal domain-containing protein n=1 Tax=Rhynchospora tenuis TaxID=198213 RepID=A0AAD5ZGV8_9POAL|nr:hypothetical protein LUZ61_001243 [Rhynchospora tenuis]